MLANFGVEHNIITGGVIDFVVFLPKAYIYRSKKKKNTKLSLSSCKYNLYNLYFIEKLMIICYQQSK